jgi:hypothetical protein
MTRSAGQGGPDERPSATRAPCARPDPEGFTLLRALAHASGKVRSRAVRSRPEIDIRVPGAVHAGDEIPVDVTLSSGSETPIDFVRVELRCLEVIRGPLNGETLASRERFILTADVAGQGRLGPGAHRYRASFRIPRNAPPSYLGATAEYRFRIDVRVSIPWWLDATEWRELTVKRPPRARSADPPVTSRSPSAHGPFVEVALPGREFAPGEAVRGAVAFGQLGGRAADSIDVALLAVERVHLQARRFTAEAHRTTFFRDVQRTPEGAEVPFQIAVAPSLTVGFETRAVTVGHLLEVRLVDLAGGMVTHLVPLEIGPFPRRIVQGGRDRVGAGQWHEAWARAGGERGLTVDPRELELTGQLAGCAVRVRPWQGEGSTPGLEASVAFPLPWGLDLTVRRRPLRFRERLLDLPRKGEASQRYLARGRDEAQVQAALLPELWAVLLAFTDVEVDDEGARVRSEAATCDEAAVGTFVERLAAFAEAASAVAAALPAPPAMAGFVPAWTAFAAAGGARLEVGRMRVRGTSDDGAMLTVETLFDGSEPVGTAITLGVDPPLAPPFDPARAADLAAASPAARELVASIQAQAAALATASAAHAPVLWARLERITLTLGAPLADPAMAWEIVRSLAELSRALRGERHGGPYR